MPKRRHAAPYTRHRRWTIDDARAALIALSASQLPLADFARREGLSTKRLYRWRRQLADQGRARRTLGAATTPRPAARVRRPTAPATEVIEIRPRRVEPVEIVLASGRVLRVPETIDVSTLARLVAALERA